MGDPQKEERECRLGSHRRAKVAYRGEAADIANPLPPPQFPFPICHKQVDHLPSLTGYAWRLPLSKVRLSSGEGEGREKGESDKEDEENAGATRSN